MPTSPSKDQLFTSIKLGKQLLAHRVVLAPLTRMRNEEYVPLKPMQATYYAQRSSPGGFLISEAALIAPSSGSYQKAPGLWNEEQKQGWRKITEAVHQEGGIIYCQLWHLGRASAQTYEYQGRSYPPLSASATKVNEKAEISKALTIEEIEGIVKQYADAARFSVEAGFDGVEIHGANGYLLDQFLQTNSNKREDRYGGSLENRLRFPLEVLDAVVAAVGQERTGLRMSPYSEFQGMKMEKPLDTFVPYVKQIVSKYKNLAYLHGVESRIGGAADQVAGEGEILQPLRDLVDEANRSNTSGSGIRFISAGGFKPQDALLESEARPNELIAFGRHFIANPDLPTRIQNRWPLNPYNRKTFYGSDEIGYTDQPVFKESSL